MHARFDWRALALLLPAACAALAGALPAYGSSAKSMAAPQPPRPITVEEDTIPKSDRNDALGDPLPAGAAGRLGTWRLLHADKTGGVVFSRDGKRLITTGRGSVLTWDVATGRRIEALADVGAGYELILSPDGKLGAVRNAREVVVWEAATGKPVHRIQAHKTSTGAIAWSPDGSRLASGGFYDKLVRVWDVRSAGRVAQFAGSGGPVEALAFSPDGGTLASGSQDQRIRLWDLKTGAEIAQLTGHRSRTIRTQTRDAAGKVVSTSTTTMRGDVNDLAFSPDGKLLASAGGGGAVLIHDVAARNIRRRLSVGDGQAHAARFSPDGRLLAAASSWHASMGYTTFQTGRVHVWTVADGKPAGAWKTGGDWLVAFSPDGKVVASAGGGYVPTLHALDPAAGAFHRPGHTDNITAVAFSPGGDTAYTAGRDGALLAWDPRKLGASAEPLRAADAETGPIVSLAVAADGKTLATAGVTSISLWDAAALKKLKTVEARLGMSAGLAFAPDGKKLLCAAQGSVRLWDPQAEKDVQTFQTPGRVMCLAISPDGRQAAAGTLNYVGGGRIASTAVGSVHLIDLAAGSVSRVLGPLPGAVNAVAFSPDAQSLATAAGDGAAVWSVAAGACLTRYQAPGHAPLAVAFDPRGDALLTAGQDGTIRLWMLWTAAEAKLLRGHLGAVTALAFAPDGRSFLSGSADTTALVWPAPAAAAPAGGDKPELAALWGALAGEDGPALLRAIHEMVRRPGESVPFLAKHAQLPLPDPKAVAALIAQLDDRAFEARQRAFDRLAAMGAAAKQALKKAAAALVSAEAQNRCRALLQRIAEGPLPPDERRLCYAVGICRRIGTPAALAVVESVAGCAAAPRAAGYAKAVLAQSRPKP